MAALIEYVCTAQHDRREEPSVTLEQGSWAYCALGAISEHRWTRIDPTAVEALRSSARNGNTRSVKDEGAPSKNGG
ncbi:MAG: hypothetical protein M3P38_09920 [Chloroflexota bacterium]|nr:hypothetical protein [Chloroflexota bacterium]